METKKYQLGDKVYCETTGPSTITRIYDKSLPYRYEVKGEKGNDVVQRQRLHNVESVLLPVNEKYLGVDIYFDTYKKEFYSTVGRAESFSDMVSLISKSIDPEKTFEPFEAFDMNVTKSGFEHMKDRLTIVVQHVNRLGVYSAHSIDGKSISIGSYQRNSFAMKTPESMKLMEQIWECQDGKYQLDRRIRDLQKQMKTLEDLYQENFKK